MRALLQKIVPRPLRYRLRARLQDFRASGHASAIRKLPRAVLDRPRLYYGVPPDEAHARGGRVKLRHLSAAFPDAPSDFNILYMVSSAPPPGAGLLAEAARARGARVVWNQDGVAYAAWYGAGFEVVNARMAPLVLGADHVFYQSGFCRTAADRFLGSRSTGAEVLHNAVDTSIFAPGRRAPEGGEPTLLLTGTHRHWYRVRAALDTLARVRRARPNARLLVMGPLGWGTSPDRAREETLAHARAAGVADVIELLGPYTQAQAPDLLRRGDILVHTQYNDACPGSVIEAMACGLPVAHGGTGGVPELVGDEAGIGLGGEASWDREIPPDPEALAEAVLRIDASRPRFAEAARARAVERFDARAWVARHRAVFERLLG